MTTVLSAGVSLKPEYYEPALAASADGMWFEVHPENYMTAGGLRLAWLDRFAERHPLSLHGVALSLAADADPDADHLRRLRALIERVQPALVSEHLAWSTWRTTYFPDLLPFPRTHQALDRIADNVARTQDALGHTIAVENPTHYVAIDGHELGEIAFLTELARRTGCGLLLDVNNVYISANNLAFSAENYLDAFPGELIREVHLAGFEEDPKLGSALLVDSHNAAVADPVWALYERLIRRVGAKPTLIERDDDLPPFAGMFAERERAHSLMHPLLLAAA